MKKENIPLFFELSKKMEASTQNLVSLNIRLMEADALIFVTPEYNGGMSAALKNMIDTLSYSPQINRIIGHINPGWSNI